MPEQIIKKLQFKLQPIVLVLAAPPEFKIVTDLWKKTASIETEINKKKKYPFALGFVKTESDVKKWGAAMIKQLEDDAVFWMAYPKKTSKKYIATITRDSGWESLGKLGFEGVSMIAIDDDWSAFRFRKAELIGSMIRRQGMAMSEKGKTKTANKTDIAIKKSK
ncbi:MAG: hypothetical protein ACRC2O_08295 [Chitinophagaceae bacterium]